MLLKFTGAPYDVPPQGFRMRFKEDGFVVKATDTTSFFEAILKHYRDNEFELPENWKELAMDQACRFWPPGWAKYEDGSVPTSFINLNFTLEDFLHGTSVIGHWTLNGRNVVDQELAESRAETCSRCFANVDIQGCVSCYNLVGMVVEASGGKQTKSEAALKSACGICKCSAKAQVWVPVESLEKGVPDSLLEQFDKIPYCWKGKEIREYREGLLNSSIER
jgi:hypothetical protein